MDALYPMIWFIITTGTSALDPFLAIPALLIGWFVKEHPWRIGIVALWAVVIEVMVAASTARFGAGTMGLFLAQRILAGLSLAYIAGAIKARRRARSA